MPTSVPNAGTTASPRNSLGAILMSLSMLGFASMDAMSKFLVRDYPIAEALWIRYLIYAAFAVVVTRRKGVLRMARSRRPLLQASRSLLSLIESAIFVLAFAFLPLAETHAIAATSPLIVIALSAPLLRERVGLHRWLAVIAGFVGVLLIVRPGFAVVSWPMALPLLGALLWALYQIMVRMCARDDAPETTLLWSAFVGLAGVSIVAPLQWHTPDPLAWVLLFGIGIMGAMAQFALIKTLEVAEASAVQPYGYTLLVWAAVLGALVFGDIPATWTFIGGGVVVLSGLYTWRQDRRTWR